MAKQIIILERVNQPSDFNFRVAYWASVPAARQPFYADATLVSRYKDISAGELSALRDGSVVEKVVVESYPSGTTANAIKSDLQAKFTAFQNEINSVNNWNFYGTFFDGTSWTTGGV